MVFNCDVPGPHDSMRSMNILHKGTWKHKEWTLQGNSTAGISTSLICPELSVAFDVGQGLPWAFNMHNFLITHSHMDHAAGIPYIISQKALTGQKPPVFYMPEFMTEKMHQIIHLWQEIEGHEYDYEFISTINGEKVPLKGNTFFKTFPTIHRVPSNGYCIFREGKKLKEELKGCDRQEILDRKSRGEEVEDRFEEPILAFTGDTQIEFLDGPEFIRKAKILVMEVTYIDDKKSVQSAREWGHIHFEELIPKLADLENEKVVLMHLSARYSCRQFQELIHRTLPEELAEKLVVFPRDNSLDDQV